MTQNLGRARTYLDDLQDLTTQAQSGQWKMRAQKMSDPNSQVDFYKIVDTDGKLVFTLGFTKGDHRTRILAEALLTKSTALVAGAGLTMQMYQCSEELASCQSLKERDGITPEYNERQLTAWRKMRELLQSIRVHLGKFATVKDLKP